MIDTYILDIIGLNNSNILSLKTNNSRTTTSYYESRNIKLTIILDKSIINKNDNDIKVLLNWFKDCYFISKSNKEQIIILKIYYLFYTIKANLIINTSYKTIKINKGEIIEEY